jgi:MoxR-like ATPase
MANPKKDTTPTLTLKPSEVASAIQGMRRTKTAIFLWGQPGISKSAVSQQVANEANIAFIDIRLSQMDPTDLRGLPYPVNEGGQEGVAWSAPLVLPRNIDINGVREIEAMDTIVSFYNPKGTNGIYYCRQPKVTAESLTEGAKAVVSETNGNRFVVSLQDENGKKVAGKVAYNVVGEVEALVALEEFNSAPPSVQAASYQLILDRRLGDYEVPEGVYLMAMGNRDTDKGVTFKMPTPIMNRFVHLEMKVDAEDWIVWALNSMVDAQVVGFISAFKDQLNKFDAGTAARGFQTPRSWEFVSKILKTNGNSLPDTILQALVVGAVGDAAGVQFMQFRKIAADLPRAEEILSGKLLKMPKQVEVQLAYALTTTLCYSLKEQIDDMRMKNPNLKELKQTQEYAKWLEQVDHFFLFIMDNFKPEIAIMGAKAALAVHKLPLDVPKMKNFDVFSDRFKSFILN